jgi:KDO2-lipid IV(A) lauroyltransferase
MGMARKRSRTADYLVYLIVRVAVCVVQILSWPAALRFARFLAWLAHRVDRRHRLIAEDNIRHAFPHLDEASVQRLTRAAYEHLTTMLIEMIRMPRVMNARNAPEYVLCDPPEDLERCLAWSKSGRPLLVLTGHFGNWEVLNYVTGLIGLRGSVVARRLDNPYLERFLERFRRKTGQQVLDKNQDYQRILEVLERKEGLGLVGDQDAGPRGLFVPFMGRPASTFKSIALLSLEYSAPILVFGTARVGHPMRYRVYFEDVILPEEYANHPDAPRAITQRYTEALERLIRRHPEQYFWLHRRWKSQPKVRQKQAA